MDLDLDAPALRVLGALVEKSLATPDYYPLSLSALVAACNQKTAREPVMSLRQDEVETALDGLLGEHLVRSRSEAGARVSKYAHRLDDELGLRFGFSRADLAVLALLMLRGPQTAGELRSRAGRLHQFNSVESVEQTLESLASATHGPFVCRLAREAGRREVRHAHCFGETPDVDLAPRPSTAPGPSGDAATPQASGLEARVAALEEMVLELGEEVERLRNQRG